MIASATTDARRHPSRSQVRDPRSRELYRAPHRFDQDQLHEGQVFDHRHGQQDRDGHREPCQCLLERRPVVAQPGRAIHDRQEEREGSQDEGQPNPLPSRLAGDRGKQRCGEQLDPGVRDHPPTRGRNELVQILQGHRSGVRQSAHALVELVRSRDGIGAEHEFAAARPCLRANQRDFGVGDHPPLCVGTPGWLELVRVRNLVAGRQLDPAQDLVQGVGRRVSRLPARRRRDFAQIQGLNCLVGQQFHAVEFGARR
jgi:hypothetical protein